MTNKNPHNIFLFICAVLSLLALIDGLEDIFTRGLNPELLIILSVPFSIFLVSAYLLYKRENSLSAYLLYKWKNSSFHKTEQGQQDQVQQSQEHQGQWNQGKRGEWHGMHSHDLQNYLIEIRDNVEDKFNERKKEKQRQDDFLNYLHRASGHEPIVAIYSGGSGYQIDKGSAILLTLGNQSLCLSQMSTEETIEIPLDDLISIEITGPGKQSSDLGLIGGGIGLEGAAKGILVASIANALTSKTEINTFMQIGTTKGEVMLHVTSVEPIELRSLLSPAFVKVRSLQVYSHHDLTTELEKLHKMFLEGVLTEAEFQLAKDKLLNKSEST